MASRLPNSFALAALAVLASGFKALAATVIVSASADTSIVSSNPDSNLGGTTLVAGTNQTYSVARALFSFNLSAIPVGATITSVQVDLTVTRQPDPDQHGGPVGSNFSLYQMLVGWGQGTGSGTTGSPAATGDATWNQNHYGVSSWAAPGGLAGTDFAADPSATTSISGLGSYQWGSTSGLVADVQSWLADPSSNFGLMLASDAENTPGSARRFASLEQPGGGIPAPQLVVTYTLANPEPSLPSLLMLGTGALALVRRRPRV